MDPTSCSHVVSGGEDDKAFVWKLSDGKIKFTCNGRLTLIILQQRNMASNHVYVEVFVPFLEKSYLINWSHFEILEKIC